MTMVVLDTCRNAPFAHSIPRWGGGEFVITPNSRPADCPIQEHLRANRPECGGSVSTQPDLPGIKKQQVPCPIKEELRLARPDCL